MTSNFNDQSLEKKIELLHALAFDNLEMQNFLRASNIYDVQHIDKKCGIFSLADDPENTFKYVVDPHTHNIIGNFLQRVVLCGLKHQMLAQRIEGVQKLSSEKFHEGIIGLLGKFEYLHGHNLAHPPENFQIEPATMLNYFEQIDRTLKEMHDLRIIHKDVKPGNLVLSNGRLHLIDFSTARDFSKESYDRSKERFFGTPGYVYFGNDRSIDYFALGVSFVKVFFPNLSLERVHRLDIHGFEHDTFKDLKLIYGDLYAAYFKDLMHRTPEVNSAYFTRRQMPLIRFGGTTYTVGKDTTYPMIDVLGGS